MWGIYSFALFLRAVLFEKRQTVPQAEAASASSNCAAGEAFWNRST